MQPENAVGASCQETPEGRSQAVRVVGLGASAGGLEPLQEFLARVPPSTGLSFLIVQHLDPRRPSLLVDLLGRHAAIPVVETTDGLKMQPDHVYVMAPGTLLALDGETIRVTAATTLNRTRAIDHLFQSLAAAQNARAAGILFSGAGSDGTEGLRAIKAQGGLTLAQSPETARHDSMPRAAIRAGCVDQVLPPAELAERLLGRLHRAPPTAEQSSPSVSQTELTRRLGELCTAIRQLTGHDFSRYKKGTLLRRIERRMLARHMVRVGSYLDLLRTEAGEAEALAGDLLIGVTQFFRDPQAFAALAERVIPGIAQSCTPDRPLRIWVAGCATGEEVFSVAMLVRERLDHLGSARTVRIFATDLDAEALDQARLGCYPRRIAADISPERLARFFRRAHDGYEVTKTLREMCIFSRHNLSTDPPFSQLDLIVCRNVLIYFSIALQEKLQQVFHGALRPGGVLFLGQSEGVSTASELFETLDAAHRIYRCRERRTPAVIELPLTASPAPLWPRTTERAHQAPPLSQRISATFDRIVLSEYASPCAVINEHGDLLRLAGRLDRHLRLPAAAPSLNVFSLAPSPLRSALKMAIRLATATRRTVLREDISIADEGRVRLSVRPLTEVDGESGLFLVVLQSAEAASPEVATSEHADPTSEVARIDADLRVRTLELQTTLENFESANEQLRTANEELQASQEELQSLNEELETVNTELCQKLDELAAANSDLQNLFASTEIATVFLNLSLQIDRFTPAAIDLLNLIPSDVGRPLADLATPFADADLTGTAREVLSTLTPIERQAQTRDGRRWISLRTLPYRTLDGRVDGVVITFVDISELKRAEDQVRQLAFYDALTGLPNRRLLEERLGVALTQVKRQGGCIAVMVLDLDYFKAINDALGHAVGDGLLVEVARRMRACMRAADTVARPGGDEFMLVVPGVKAQGAAHLASKLVKRLVEPLSVDGHEITIGCSVGISLAPDDGCQASELIAHADTAMYRAKQAGRNRYQFFTEDMQREALRMMTLEHQLRQALGGTDLCLYYQPQVELDSGQAIGLEALIRWMHPTKGRLLGASEFIPFAEKSGLILDLGAWVLQAVIRQMQAWSHAGLPLLPVAVNLSAQQFRHPDRRRALSLQVNDLLQESGLPPALLELEITENSLLEETEGTLATLQELRTLGVRLTLDDFGTGYSSLSTLNAFPVDRLKIDQSFVRAAPDNPKQAAIIETILALGRHLDFEVIAEGVETSEHLEQLRRQGCHQAQGFYFSEPLPPTAVEPWLRQMGSGQSPSPA